MIWHPEVSSLLYFDLIEQIELIANYLLKNTSMPHALCSEYSILSKDLQSCFPLNINFILCILSLVYRNLYTVQIERIS